MAEIVEFKVEPSDSFEAEYEFFDSDDCDPEFELSWFVRDGLRYPVVSVSVKDGEHYVRVIGPVLVFDSGSTGTE